MDTSTLGNIGDFVGGIAVIASLIYLAIQVKQNTKAVRTASRQEIVSGFREHMHYYVTPEMAKAYSKGLSSYPDMPFEERGRFASAIVDLALFFQGVFSLHESGQLEDETYLAYLNWFSCHITTPGGQAWWKEIAKPFFT